jgi:hypothetical protein
MSRLLRVAALVLFLTVLVVKPTPVGASGFDTCTYYGYYGYDIYVCTDDCQTQYSNWYSFPISSNCIIANCYEDGNDVILWVQCF